MHLHISHELCLGQEWPTGATLAPYLYFAFFDKLQYIVLFVCCLRENGQKLQAENRQGSILTGQSTTLYRGCSEQRAVSAFGFKTVPEEMQKERSQVTLRKR